MKEFMLLIRNQLGHHESLSAEQEQAFVEKCMLYIDKLTKDGKLKAAQPMERQGAMLSGTKGAWKEGPFHETKEVLVGYITSLPGICRKLSIWQRATRNS